MTTRYMVAIASNTGQPLETVQPIQGEYTLSEGEIGVLSFTLPPSMPLALLQKDGQIHIQRSIDGGGPYLEGDATWLIRRRRQMLSGRERLTQVWAVHANQLLKRRIVAYAAGSAQASKSGAADNLIKAIVRENFISPTDTARTMSGLAVQADTTQGPIIDKAFSRRNALAVLQDICDTAASLGTYLGFEVRSFAGDLVLMTYTQQRGVDRRAGTANYLRVSPTTGAIAESSLDEDWTDESTFVYALGQGEGEDRQAGTARNATAEGLSPFGRVEDSYQANQSTSQAQLDDDAAGELYQRRARELYEAKGQESPGFRYGRDYKWGDLLTVSDFGRSFDVRVNPVRVRFGRNGEEIDTRFTSDSVGLAL